MRNGMRLTSASNGADGRRHRPGAGLSKPIAGLLSVLLCALLAWAPSVTAEPSCTDTWTGPSEGSWGTAANWSTSAVPGSSDVACVGPGATVHISGGSEQAGVLRDEGALVVSGGSLELTSTTDSSMIASLTVSGGTLTGAGAVMVSGSFSWTGGTMSGSGKTDLEAGATGSINPGSSGTVTLNERELVNAGSVTWSSGSISGGYGARIDNSGTFFANAQDPGGSWFSTGMLRGGGATAAFVNTGTLDKSSGNGLSVIQFALQNSGTVEDSDAEGQLSFTGGTTGSASGGSWVAPTSDPWAAGIVFTTGSFALGEAVEMSGAISLAGGNVEVGSIDGPSAKLTLWSSSSTLTVTDASTPTHLENLTIQDLAGATTLTGAGTVDVAGSLSWTGGNMTGAGKTVLASGATGSIEAGSGNSVKLAGRTLKNEGTLTLSSGSLSGSESAELDNSGTFNANVDAPGSEWWLHGMMKGDSSAVWLHNTGTVRKTVGTVFTQIGWQIDNEGTVEAKTGQIIMSGGNHGTTEQSGSWVGAEGASIAFNANSYVFGSAELSGSIFLAGGNVKAGDLQGPSATLYLWSGGSSKLDLTGTTASSHLGTLDILNNTTLAGAATLHVATALSVEGNATIEGTGKLVLDSGATGSTTGSCARMHLSGATFLNEGTFTLTSGSAAMWLGSGARLDNAGTFKDQTADPGCGYGSGSISIYNGGGTAPAIVNTGTLLGEGSGGTLQVLVPVQNEGTVEAKSGTLEPRDGGEDSKGTWKAATGTTVAFAAGSFGVTEDTFSGGGTVALTGASVTATALKATGNVSLSSGSLAITSGSIAEVSGSGSLQVSGNFPIAGPGRLKIATGASGSTAGSCARLVLNGSTLDNEGTFTLTSGSAAMWLENGAQLQNAGTVDDNSVDPACGYGSGGSSIYAGAGSAPAISNTGTFHGNPGSGSGLPVRVQFDNEGTVNADSGVLQLLAGGSGSAGTWSASSSAVLSLAGGSFSLSGDTWSGAGTVAVEGATVTAAHLEAGSAHVGVGSGTLTIPEGTTASVTSLSLGSATLDAVGELDVSGSFSQSGTSTVEGAGRFVLGSSATGSTAGSCARLLLNGATVVNDGTFTLTSGSGALWLENGAEFDNTGTFIDQSSDPGCGYGSGGTSIYNGGGTASRFENAGTFVGESGGTLQILVPFDNQGTVEANNGTLEFRAGGVSEKVAAGIWTTHGGASIVLGAGLFLIGEEVDLSHVTVSGATVERMPVKGAPRGYLYPHPYAALTAVLYGYGKSVGTGFSGATIEVTPSGSEEWKALCSGLTPSLTGEYECAWNTALGGYPDGSYRARAQSV